MSAGRAFRAELERLQREVRTGLFRLRVNLRLLGCELHRLTTELPYTDYIKALYGASDVTALRTETNPLLEALQSTETGLVGQSMRCIELGSSQDVELFEPPLPNREPS